MLALITNLIIAARYYFQIRATAADYELTQRIEQDIEGLESSINALRDRGDPDAQRLADRLRERLLRAQGIAGNLSAARAAAQGGAGSADSGRPLPPAGG